MSSLTISENVKSFLSTVYFAFVYCPQAFAHTSLNYLSIAEINNNDGWKALIFGFDMTITF